MLGSLETKEKDAPEHCKQSSTGGSVQSLEDWSVGRSTDHNDYSWGLNGYKDLV